MTRLAAFTSSVVWASRREPRARGLGGGPASASRLGSGDDGDDGAVARPDSALSCELEHMPWEMFVKRSRRVCRGR